MKNSRTYCTIALTLLYIFCVNLISIAQDCFWSSKEEIIITYEDLIDVD